MEKRKTWRPPSKASHAAKYMKRHTEVESSAASFVFPTVPDTSRDGPDPRTAEYIALLERRNVLIKRLEAKNKSKRDMDLETREKQFCTHFSGANASTRVNQSNLAAAKRSQSKSIHAPEQKNTHALRSTRRNTWQRVSLSNALASSFPLAIS